MIAELRRIAVIVVTATALIVTAAVLMSLF